MIPTQGKSCAACGYVNDWKAARGISQELGASDFSKSGKETPRVLTTNGKQASVPGVGTVETGGWTKTCDCCETSERKPACVLDPFGGAGTTSLVADRLGRNSIWIDLDERNLKLVIDRISPMHNDENIQWNVIEQTAEEARNRPPFPLLTFGEPI